MKGYTFPYSIILDSPLYSYTCQIPRRTEALDGDHGTFEDIRKTRMYAALSHVFSLTVLRFGRMFRWIGARKEGSQRSRMN